MQNGTRAMEWWQRQQASAPRRDLFSAVTTWLIGAMLVGTGLTNLWSPFRLLEMGGALRWWLLVPLTVGCAAMLFKRQRPVAALAVATGCFIADMVASGGSLGMLLVLFDLLFTVGMLATPRVRMIVITAFVLGSVGLATAVAVAVGEVHMLFFIALQFSAVVVVPLWWSGNLRQQQRLAELADSRAATERERAELAREHALDQSRLADLARQDAIQHERAAMARDIHDVIASHLSSVAIHSGAALSRSADPEADRRALQVVREESLASLTEMRAMIHLLRSPDDAAEADDVPGGLDRLDRLVAGFRARGSELAADAVDVTGLPCDVDRAAYRIIHEALTNASKHAPGSPIRLALGRTDDVLEVSVDNALAHSPRIEGDEIFEDSLHSGIGLVSMRERSASLGGTFHAGPNRAGAWEVRARLPLGFPPGVRTPEESTAGMGTVGDTAPRATEVSR